MSTILEDAILSQLVDSSSAGAGEFPPFAGTGVQGSLQYRGERYRATETPHRFRARDAEMLGTTDKDFQEKVWYEVEMVDVLRGASILSCDISTTDPLLVVHSKELVSNGATVHLVRALVGGGVTNRTMVVVFYFRCSDGSVRVRRLRIRGRDL